MARLRDRGADRRTVGITDRRTVGIVARCDGALAGVALASGSRTGTRRSGISTCSRYDRPLAAGASGRALLGRAEAELAGLGVGEVRLAGNPPYYAWPGIDVRYTPAVCLALALGYQPERYGVEHDRGSVGRRHAGTAPYRTGRARGWPKRAHGTPGHRR